MRTYERILKVGKKDAYTVTINRRVLEGETLTSATVTTDDSTLTILGTTFADNVIEAVCQGVSDGTAVLKFSWATISRSDCVSYKVRVADC